MDKKSRNFLAEFKDKDGWTWEEFERLIIKYFGLSRRKEKEVISMLDETNLQQWDRDEKLVKPNNEAIKEILRE